MTGDDRTGEDRSGEDITGDGNTGDDRRRPVRLIASACSNDSGAWLSNLGRNGNDMCFRFYILGVCIRFGGVTLLIHLFLG